MCKLMTREDDMVKSKSNHLNKYEYNIIRRIRTLVSLLRGRIFLKKSKWIVRFLYVFL